MAIQWWVAHITIGAFIKPHGGKSRYYSSPKTKRVEFNKCTINSVFSVLAVISKDFPREISDQHLWECHLKWLIPSNHHDIHLIISSFCELEEGLENSRCVCTTASFHSKGYGEKKTPSNQTQLILQTTVGNIQVLLCRALERNEKFSSFL